MEVAEASFSREGVIEVSFLQKWNLNFTLNYSRFDREI